MNPYRGCAHACAYCYAQDVTRFELGKPWGSEIEVKVNIVQRLKREVEKGVRGVYGVGTVTDPYQPIEREYELTRGCLAVLKHSGARVSILTKSDLVLRDLDILRSWKDVEVGVSISCIDELVAKSIEPEAPSPSRRFNALARLAGEGVESFLMMAPIISGVTDSDVSLRALVREANRSGIRSIIWDKYNPKRVADLRLRHTLEAAGSRIQGQHSPQDVMRMRRTLEEECGLLGTELKDAF